MVVCFGFPIKHATGRATPKFGLHTLFHYSRKDNVILLHNATPRIGLHDQKHHSRLDDAMNVSTNMYIFGGMVHLLKFYMMTLLICKLRGSTHDGFPLMFRSGTS